MDTTIAPVLIELGTEELPPKSLRSLQDAFAEQMYVALLDRRLIDTNNTKQVKAYATPRRLAVIVKHVKSKQEKQSIEKLGPALKAAYDDAGKPTPAALGFAKSCGVEFNQISSKQTDKGERLFHTIEQEGETLQSLINETLQQAIKRLPIAKRMRWGDSPEEFVRPVHWLLALYNNQTLEAQALGLQASNLSYGHRYHHPKAIPIQSIDDYASTLEQQGKVIVDFDTRLQSIQAQKLSVLQTINAQSKPSPALLDEVTAMVEWPVALLGTFDSAFLDVPAECLISSMRDHQKYFHIENENGALMPYFITVSNIESNNVTSVIEGNERVLRARLADAKFFWEVDKRHSLESRIDTLHRIIFHQKLGSVFEKVQRLVASAKTIATLLDTDITLCERAALLSKADLNSDMVNEFDSLQGTMGKYYAQNDGENQIVANAIEQHYWPKFSGDQLPKHPVSDVIALTDRLDNLLGIFYTQETPTGDKDPYGLRRAALSILRILIEHEYDVSLKQLIQASAHSFQTQNSISITEEVQQQVYEYITARFTAFYQSKSISTSTIHAVIASGCDKPLDFHHRLIAVNTFSTTADATNLIAANKRISNIIKKGIPSKHSKVQQNLLIEEAESDLFKAIDALETQCKNLFAERKYLAGLELLAQLKAPIDTFFANVMVMAEEEEIRSNRINLLAKVHQLFLGVADISHLNAD